MLRNHKDPQRAATLATPISRTDARDYEARGLCTCARVIAERRAAPQAEGEY